MARRNSRTYRAAQVQAQAAQAQVLAARAELSEEPMRRYPHPIPTGPAAAREDPDLAPAVTRALEQLQCQSQLLVDLLGAVNALTAAVLAQGGKT